MTSPTPQKDPLPPVGESGGSWTVEDFGYPDYLDGIKSQFAVRDEHGAPVAYAFEAGQAAKLAAAPELLAALIELRTACNQRDRAPSLHAADRYTEALFIARAAISNATQPDEASR